MKYLFLLLILSSCNPASFPPKSITLADIKFAKCICNQEGERLSRIISLNISTLRIICSSNTRLDVNYNDIIYYEGCEKP